MIGVQRVHPHRRTARAALRRRSLPAATFSVMLGAWALVAPAAANAQLAETTLIAPVLPQGFDRGRNVSVAETQRPDYDPLGIQVGSFIAYPKLNVGLGATTNVYLVADDKTSAVFATVNPSIRVGSNWSVHQLTFSGGAQLRRYFGESRRNEDVWNLGTTGRLDVGSYITVSGEAQASRQYETPFSGEVSSDLAVLSSFTRGYVALRGQYQAGQTRAIVTVDRAGYDFSRIDLGNGAFRSQANRDRDLTRFVGQGEFAFTPSVSVYGQGTVTLTRYDQPLGPGIPNRDSDGFRVIAGVNFDLASFIRGTIGAGYTKRNFKAARYDSVDGVSVEGRIEYFPSELTTFTLALRRVIEDSSISASNAFFDNRASLRVDHALLRNLILNATAELARQDYIGTTERANVVRVVGGGRYLLSRVLSIDTSLSFVDRNSRGLNFDASQSEFRGQVGVTLQR